ncbi:MAG: sigma-54 dependent transcriptional regulator [Planctomycetaceae bacterium]
MAFEQRLLLSSTDASLHQTFRQVAAVVPGLRLTLKEDLQTLLEALRHDAERIGVVVLHLRDTASEWVHIVLRRIAAAGLAIPVWVVCDDPDFGAIRGLELLKSGAAECLVRPLEARRLRFLLESSCLRVRRRSEAEVSRPVESRTKQLFTETGEFFACRSAAMEQFVRRMRRVAPEEISVLITGETGTGKTRVAKVLHQLSPRRSEPFVAVNCAALPENLVESELFGHRRGAFTGADTNHAGRFAAAAGGTILLDEIDSLPLAAQAKLLHAVDSRTFSAVGSTETTRLRARILIATNADLAAEVAAGRFRQDLYYRLNVAELHLPPLRDRRDEIRELVDECVGEWAARHDGFAPEISPEAWALLEAYDWPGNIRELRNVIERSLVFCDAEVLTPEDLPAALQSARAVPDTATPETAADDWTIDFSEADDAVVPSANPLRRARREAELVHLRETLVRTGNNRARAARELGISRPGLYKKLRQFGLL